MKKLKKEYNKEEVEKEVKSKFCKKKKILLSLKYIDLMNILKSL